MCNYIVSMKAQIVSIGNSQGIRIPKVLLEQSNLSGEVDLELHELGILIKKTRRPREDWEAAFKIMAENDDDDISGDETHSSFDRGNWRW
jgi:antitoxin MazE